MHNERDLVEKRIQRELWERVLPLVHVDRRPLTIEAGPDLDHLEPFEVGSSWGAPWATTWFRLAGDIPPEWADRRVEAVIDLGFHQLAAGFQCEGLLVDVAADGTVRPLQGIHPRRTNYTVDAVAGPIVLHLEAASNPMFPGYRPSHLGSLDTAGDRQLYRFRQASLVVVDPAAEALAYDIEVLDGVMRSLASDDPRRARLLRRLAETLDRIPDIAAAQRVIAPAMAEDFGEATRHRSVAIGHAHIDTAWLWPMRETKRKVTRTFASAAALMDDYPEYRFCASSAQHYTWIEDRQPELFAKIVERVERGQWVPVGGMWVEADMNLPSGESLVRQIVYGQRYFEEQFGVRCTEVWIPDVFGYPAGLPQVFAAGGMRPVRHPEAELEQAEPLPAQHVLVGGPRRHAGAHPLPAGRHLQRRDHPRGVRVLDHELPRPRLEQRLADAVRSRRRRRRPDPRDAGAGSAPRATSTRAPRLEVDSPSAMFERIERDADRGAPVPVWRGELYFEMHRGTLTSQLKTKLGNRRCERLLVEAELWAATLGRPAEVDDLWKQVLTQQFHDILPGSSIAWVHEDAEADPRPRWKPNSSSGSPHSSSELGAGDRHRQPGRRGRRRGRRVDRRRARWASDSRDGTTAARVAVPALGVAPLVALPVDDRVVLSDTSMTNRHLAVRWDPYGNITSIIDLAHAREIVPTGSLSAVLELAPDHPVEYDAWDLESWTRAGAQALTRCRRR